MNGIQLRNLTYIERLILAHIEENPGQTHEDIIKAMDDDSNDDIRMRYGRAVEYLIFNGYARRNEDNQAVYIREE